MFFGNRFAGGRGWLFRHDGPFLGFVVANVEGVVFQGVDGRGCFDIEYAAVLCFFLLGFVLAPVEARCFAIEVFVTETRGWQWLLMALEGR